MVAAHQQVSADRRPVVSVRDGAVFTNSRDVAEFFGKEHRHILRDIDALIAVEPALAEGGVPNFGQTQYVEGQNGQTYRSFDMDRDGFAVLAMGFTGAKALRWKLQYISTFNAMEAEIAARPVMDPVAALNDPATMRGLLLSYSEKVLTLEAANATLVPKAEALDRIATADGSLSITEAAKALQIRPKDLFDYLSHHGWIYKRPGSANWLGYQSKTSGGLMEHKVTTVLRADGTEKVAEQVRVTAKGMTRLASLIPPPASAAT